MGSLGLPPRCDEVEYSHGGSVAHGEGTLLRSKPVRCGHEFCHEVRRLVRGEGDADLVASLMTSTILGALLVLLGTGDKDLATRTVDAAASPIEMLFPAD